MLRAVSLELCPNFLINGRSARDDRADVGEITRFLAHLLVESGQHGGHGRDQIGSIAIEDVEHRFDFETRVQVNRGSLGQARQQADRKTISVEERQDTENAAVAVFLAAPGAKLESV